jgi:hypothetical protein
MEDTKQNGQLPAWIYYGLLLLLAAAFVLHDNSADRDLWHRLALGHYFFQHHALPMRDVFSYLSRQTPLYDHEWACGVLFYILNLTSFGWGLVACKFVVFVAVVLLVDRNARAYDHRRNMVSLTWAALAALALLPTFVSTIRCLVFTNLFFALWLYWLSRLRAGYHVPIWYFALTAALWANLHGGFIAGLGLIGLYAIGEKLNRRPTRDLVHIGLAAAAATLCNPYTYHLWISSVKAVVSPRVHIYEWAATPLWDFSYFGFKLLAIFTILTALIWLVRRTGPWDWVAILTTGVTLYLAIQHLRHIALFSIIGSVFTYRGIAMLQSGAVVNRGMLVRRLGNYLAAAYATALIVLSLFLLGTGDGFRLRVSEPDYPVRAIEFLEMQPTSPVPKKLLVPFNWGSYAMWHLYPGWLVSMDGRYELVYSQATYRAQSDLFFNQSNPDSDRLISHTSPDAIVFPRDASLEQRMANEFHFRLVYQDDLATVMTR